MRVLGRAFLLSLVAFSLLVLPGAVRGQKFPPSVGEPAPDFDLQGFRLAGLKGKWHVVLVFYRGFF
ncbi:MAG: hypothetical protein ACE5JJ_04200 [Nitrospinota bacterium]